MDWLQLIIQGGAVGICVFLIYMNGKERKESQSTLKEIVGNHIDHSTKAMTDLSSNTATNTEALHGLSTTIHSIIEKIKS